MKLAKSSIAIALLLTSATALATEDDKTPPPPPAPSTLEILMGLLTPGGTYQPPP